MFGELSAFGIKYVLFYCVTWQHTSRRNVQFFGIIIEWLVELAVN